ncbi:hypothetical protein [Marinifilum sp.]|uniref:hypothetical protein n=1 Tax=Marinifilum sp. TaxID=2033137 RepID=UPI003BAA3E58
MPDVNNEWVHLDDSWIISGEIKITGDVANVDECEQLLIWNGGVAADYNPMTGCCRIFSH